MSDDLIESGSALGAGSIPGRYAEWSAGRQQTRLERERGCNGFGRRDQFERSDCAGNRAVA
jgi:hypothetical protein